MELEVSYNENYCVGRLRLLFLSPHESTSIEYEYSCTRIGLPI